MSNRTGASPLAAAMKGEKVTDRQAKTALGQAVTRITSLTKRANASKDAMVQTGSMVVHTAETQGSLFLASMAEGYFGDLGMLAYVGGVQRQEIRRDMASVKHQDLAGSNIGDDHKEYFSGENALLAGGVDNTMNQF